MVEGCKTDRGHNKLLKILQRIQTNCLSVFGHFVGLALKGLKN